MAVAAAEDEYVLEAVKVAKEQGLADSILVGDEKKIRKLADFNKGFLEKRLR